jgi:hypothetical protein
MRRQSLLILTDGLSLIHLACSDSSSSNSPPTMGAGASTGGPKANAAGIPDTATTEASADEVGLSAPATSGWGPLSVPLA